MIQLGFHRELVKCKECIDILIIVVTNQLPKDG